VVETRTTTVTRDLTGLPRRLGVQSTLRRLPAAAGVPAQLLITEHRPDPRIANDNDIATRWVLLLQRTNDGWRTVYERGFDWAGFLQVWTGDLTGDRHADVLVSSEEGSGGCGPHVAIATVRGRPREIFRRQSCETQYAIRAGGLEIDEPVGLCPVPDGGAHCFGGRRTSLLRWTGTRFVRASARVECTWPKLDLDPADECR
jgi:hypothetical protein